VLSQGRPRTGQDRAGSQRAAAVALAANDTRKRDGAQGRGCAWRQSARQDRDAFCLTIKPNTDNMREARSISLITALQDIGATVRSTIRSAWARAKLELPGITY
jgi:UDPglucose 6-dehydrogenase